MNNFKLLLLLLSFVIFINYINYFMPNRDKLHNKIELLSYKIKKENKLNNQKTDIKKLKLTVKNKFYNGKKYNYSQSMGKSQEIITKSAKNNCMIKHLKWAQVPLSTKWYDVLKIDTTLECTPKKMFIFINKLRNSGKICNIKNFTIYKMRNKPKLQLRMQLISYRIHNEK